MNLHFKRNVFISYILTIIFILWSVAMFFSGARETIANNLYAIYAIIYLIAGIWGIIYSRKIERGIIHSALNYWGVSLIFYSIALFIQTYYVTFIGQEFYPSIADWFFFAHIVFLFIGSFYVLKIYINGIGLKHIIGGMIGILLSGFVTYRYFGVPEFGVEDSTFWIDFFNSFYVLTGFLSMLLIILILIFAGGKIFKGLVYFVLGIATQTLGDILFITRYEAGTFWAGDISDIIYVISGLLYALAVIYTAQGFLSKKREQISTAQIQTEDNVNLQ